MEKPGRLGKREAGDSKNRWKLSMRPAGRFALMVP
jgi:hypothetical protein